MADIKQVGDWIGDRFEVFEVHAGGMGVVYIAHDHQAQVGPRAVALKTLREEFLIDRHRAARFETECRLWVQLGRHPNVVQALAVEELEGRPHVVLELVTGGDLRRLIGSGRLDLTRALRFGLQVCLGMEHANRAGLQCHRDLKPGNLLVAGDDTLKITDFGLARLRDEILADLPVPVIPLDVPEGGPTPIIWTDPRDRSLILPAQAPAPEAEEPSSSEELPDTIETSCDPPSLGFELQEDDPLACATVEMSAGSQAAAEAESLRLTLTGAMLGTGPYMAPEQFEDAKAVDGRADIYATGILLYEMIAGELPFRGKSLAMLRRQHELYRPPSLTGKLVGVDDVQTGEVDRIIHRCLRKDPDARFGSFPDLRRAITRLLGRIDPGFNPSGN